MQQYRTLRLRQAFLASKRGKARIVLLPTSGGPNNSLCLCLLRVKLASMSGVLATIIAPLKSWVRAKMGSRLAAHGALNNENVGTLNSTRVRV